MTDTLHCLPITEFIFFTMFFACTISQINSCKTFKCDRDQQFDLEKIMAGQSRIIELSIGFSKCRIFTSQKKLTITIKKIFRTNINFPQIISQK
jgi:hypothetical protein